MDHERLMPMARLMKVIVISGACSNVGKTTLAGELQRLLEGSEVVKIGHGQRKPEMANHLYALGTSFRTIEQNHSQARWLVIESNSILREVQPDLLIYLEGKHPKPSAERAKRRADIISGRLVRDDVEALAARLEIGVDMMLAIVRLTGRDGDPSAADQDCG